MVHIHKKIHHHAVKHRQHFITFASLLVAVVFISGAFFITRGSTPHASELAFTERSSISTGSVIPASCESGVDHAGECACYGNTNCGECGNAACPTPPTPTPPGPTPLPSGCGAGTLNDTCPTPPTPTPPGPTPTEEDPTPTVSVNATSPINVTPSAAFNYTFNSSASDGSNTACRLLNGYKQNVTSYATGITSIASTSPSANGRYLMYIRCRSTTYTSATAEASVFVQVCPSGQTWSTSSNSCISPPPDLTASVITPTTASVGVAITFSSTISNLSAASTGATQFYTLFQIAPSSSGVGASDIGTSALMGPVAGSGNTVATRSYTFSSVGTYYLRACADKSSMADVNGVIAESNENNNCSGTWTAITVTNPAVTGTIAFSPTTCTITASSSNCTVNTVWSTQNATTTVSVTRAYDSNSVVTTGTSGTFPVSFPSGTYSFNLRYAGNTLATATVTAACESGTIWNGSICQATPPVVADHTLTGNNTPSGTISFTCAYSNKYSIVRAEGATGIFPQTNKNYSSPVSVGVTVAGNYTITCHRGSQSDSRVVTYNPTPTPASNLTLTATPRSIERNAKVTLNWSITNPNSTCRIIATAICTGTCGAAETSAATALQTILDSGSTDTNDQYGASRTMTSALQTPYTAGGTKAQGKKTLQVLYTTDFKLQCGTQAASTTIRVLVTNNNEG